MTNTTKTRTRQIVESHLPALRRFAWAYTGSRSAGDAAALTLLKSLLDTPSLFETQSSIKLRLFQLLYDHMTAGSEAALDNIAALEIGVSTLGSEVRAVFLLSALERFGSSEIAQIIDQPESRAKFLIRRAETLSQRHKALDVLIIEDEALIAMELKTIVEQMGHRVVGRATTHQQALMLARQHKPDLVLADVKLAQDSCGIDAVSDLRSLSNIEPVFVTAFPDRVSKRLASSPLFIVSKPFAPDLVETTISQAAMQFQLSRENRITR